MWHRGNSAPSCAAKASTSPPSPTSANRKRVAISTANAPPRSPGRRPLPPGQGTGGLRARSAAPEPRTRVRHRLAGTPKKSLRPSGSGPGSPRVSRADPAHSAGPSACLRGDRQRVCGAGTLPRHLLPNAPRQEAAGSKRSGQDCRVAGRALTSEQQQQVWEHLHSERFRDKAPPQIVAILLDEGIYLCSVSTMYRLLRTSQRSPRAPKTTPARPGLAPGTAGKRP